jgi:hypothetical protein
MHPRNAASKAIRPVTKNNSGYLASGEWSPRPSAFNVTERSELGIGLELEQSTVADVISPRNGMTCYIGKHNSRKSRSGRGTSRKDSSPPSRLASVGVLVRDWP